MTPGIYYHLSRSDYDAIDAVNWSSLKHGERSMAHYRAAIEQPPETTDVQAFGDFAHAYCLEPETLLDRFVALPKLDGRTKAGKDQKTTIELLEAEGKRVVDPATLEAAKSMRTAIEHHRSAAPLLYCAKEVSFVWQDAETGLLCKGRVDLFQEPTVESRPIVADLKTSKNAAPWSFTRDAATYRYHCQAAFYWDGIKATYGVEPARFFIIAVEKLPPYGVVLYYFTPWSIDVGRETYRKILCNLRDARRLNVWPGYDETPQELALPRWVEAEAADRDETAI